MVLTVTDHIAHVCLNRPDRHNAIDGPTMDALITAAHTIGADSAIRVVVLSGEGPSFCAGLDMASFAEMASGDLSADTPSVQAAYADLSPGGANRAQQVGWLWHELPVPVIAAVQGAALGGGLNLALAADIRIVAPDAKLGFVEVTWGLMPDMSASQSLRRLVGSDRAKYLMLTGARFSGNDAHNWGLATEVHDKPLDRANEIAAVIAGHNPEATRAIKKVIDDGAELSRAEGLALEASESGALLGAANQIEAVTARLESRPADFVDPR